MKPQLFLITKDFPHGHSEDSFVKPEYPYLCEKFQVEIIPAESKEFQTQSLWEKMFSFLCFLCEKDCYRELWDIWKDGKHVLGRSYRVLMFGTAAESFYRKLKKTTGLNSQTKAIYYFYWFDYRCFGLTMHKYKYPGIKIVARTHGYDLYDYRELYGKQFFKPQMDEKLDRLIFAAQYAKNYYLQRYQKADGAKYPLHRLGVSDKNVSIGDKSIDNIQTDVKDTFLILSCSHAIDIKRVDKIIDGLSSIEQYNGKIKWVHIGGGDQLEQLQVQAQEKLIDKKHIEYIFTDAWTNAQVLDFYKEHYVNCFITTTSTEGGSPVSVQEALSFGIPVIATDVGELSQMVCGNGILLSENPNKEEIANAIKRICSLYGSEQYVKMCKKSLEIYYDKFDAERNFKAIADELVSLSEEI